MPPVFPLQGGIVHRRALFPPQAKRRPEGVTPCGAAGRTCGTAECVEPPFATGGDSLRIGCSGTLGAVGRWCGGRGWSPRTCHGATI
ncbi:MAG: hypothetical protein D6725_08505 [Planctomycetota bacterium]|nr:MAG: hypothetical protein D6725_08505 [Planctomycetota bacterium]